MLCQHISRKYGYQNIVPNYSAFFIDNSNSIPVSIIRKTNIRSCFQLLLLITFEPQLFQLDQRFLRESFHPIDNFSQPLRIRSYEEVPEQMPRPCSHAGINHDFQFLVCLKIVSLNSQNMLLLRFFFPLFPAFLR